MKCCVLSIALYSVEIWTLRKVYQKYLEIYGMWYWRRMEKISCTEGVRKEEVLGRVIEERNIPHTMTKRKANLIGRILCRNGLLKHLTE